MPGEHSVEITFTGVLNDKLRGFYRSTFRDADGDEQVIATTQMQATDCRRAFPCWDEPDFKAVFSITLVIEPELLAVSNGPEIERRAVTTPAGEKVAVRFADTMLMSTYLAAFVVGPLEVTEPVDVGGIPLRVVHVPGKGHLTGFGLEVGAFSLRWFQDYYGIPYPSDKVDLLALPDFAAGAMENLGCITFRESLLLIDPATATQHEQEVVADVVAHELAHMWFGDLVTMGWWNGIWLNEAFATFMEIAACDAYRPDWERWTTFGLERSAAFETDSLASTRSVEYEVRSPADCEGMFDVLTYQKGGALLRMLEQYLGAERFREGVSHYLRTNAYSNTDTSDLWDAIEVTVARRCGASWTRGSGTRLPADHRRSRRRAARRASVSVHVRCRVRRQPRCGPCRSRSQRRPRRDAAPRWARRRASRSLTHRQPSSSTQEGTRSSASSYDDALRARLTGDALRSLDTLERYNLVDDAWNAVIAGHLPATDLLDVPRRVRRRARVRRLAGDRHQPARVGTPPRRRRVPAFAATRARCSSVRRSPISVNQRRTRATWWASSAGCSPARSRYSAATPQRRRGAASCTTDRKPNRVRSIRSWWRPPRASSPRPAARPNTSGCSPGSVRRRHRRISSATSMRWPSSTAPS